MVARYNFTGQRNCLCTPYKLLCPKYSIESHETVLTSRCIFHLMQNLGIVFAGLKEATFWK